GLVERLHQECGAAVEDRGFDAVHFYKDVVDAKPEQRRHDMLDGRDMHTSRIAEHRAEIGSADLRYQRPDFLVVAFGVAAMENDARIGIGRAEMDGHRPAAV